MKLLLTCLLLLNGVFSQAINYKVDLGGSDGNDGITSPWKTISKVNSFTYSSGDIVSFRKDQVFVGNLVPKSNVTYNTYGPGLTNAILSGAIPVTGWTVFSGNIWQASVVSGAYTNLVTVNGVAVPMGRYPNVSDGNLGYLTYESHSGNSAPGQGTNSITSSQLDGVINWRGAELVLRKLDWQMDRCNITNQATNILFYSNVGNASLADPKDGSGFFIQNDIRTLDQQNEWYYNPVASILYMYSVGAPSGVSMGVNQNLVNISNVNNVQFNNLIFEGADSMLFNIVNTSYNIRVINCELRNSGFDGVFGDNVHDLIFDSCYVHNINNTGFDFPYEDYVTNVTIHACTILKCGLFAGMGGQNNQQRDGILAEGHNSNISYNYIDSTGYCGITVNGSNVYVNHNEIYHFNAVVKDGGGIYTNGGGVVGHYKTNRLFSYNVIGYSIGDWQGAPPGPHIRNSSSAIYLDESSANVIIDHNYVHDCSEAGIFIHNSGDIRIANNIIDRCHNGIVLQEQNLPTPYTISNMDIKSNLLISEDPYTELISIQTYQDNVSTMGVIDSNYYRAPFSTSGILNYARNGNSSREAHDLAGWRSRFGFDVHGQFSSLSLPEYNSITPIGSNKAVSSSILASGGGEGRLYMGALTVGHYYLFKFTISGSVNNNINSTFYGISDNGTTYPVFTNPRYFSVNTIPFNGEFLFTPIASVGNGFMEMVFNHQSGSISLTNLDVHEVTYSPTNIDQVMTSVINTTIANKTVPLNGIYKDDYSNTYSGSITLLPFQFTSLIKVSDLAISDQGLTYKYYEGSYNVLPNFDNLTPIKTNSSGNIDISQRTMGVDDNFAFMWQGYIHIKTPGVYTFETNSDDGSKLYFNTFYSSNAVPLVNNDGLHGPFTPVSASINISDTGTYPIAITYFEKDQGQSIDVYWGGPGIARTLIPNVAFIPQDFILTLPPQILSAPKKVKGKLHIR